MADGTCDQPNAAGDACQRPAGWGTDRNDGPCKDHQASYHNPTKLTPETKSTLVGAAQEGAFKEHCAQIAGITPQTLRNWLDWGEADVEADVDSPCADLFLAYQRARGAGAVRRLKDASTEFVLERSYGYTRTERLEADVTQKTTHELGDDERDLALETIRQLQRTQTDE